MLRDESLLVRFQEPIDLVLYSLGDGVIYISLPAYHVLLTKGCNLFFQSKYEPCSANWSYSATDNKKHECFNWAMESFTKSMQLSQTLNTYLWNEKILLQTNILKNNLHARIVRLFCYLLLHLIGGNNPIKCNHTSSEAKKPFDWES